MGCSGECNSCSTTCSSDSRKSMIEPGNQYSKVKKVIGIVSGKGGVGKSLTTSYLSVLMNRKGYKTAILDADITGPSIPKTFGINSKASGNELGMFPAVSKAGIKVMSVNLLLDSEEMPVVWRGPVVAGTVKQFWTDVIWDQVDYMFVDMPPGTADIPLTVFQSIPLDGIIIVTSPQELVSMIVGKAVNMAKAMNVPILGLVENYSYISCGNCGEKIRVFGESHVDEVSAKYGIPVLDRVPIDPAIPASVDKGSLEELKVPYLDETAAYIEEACALEEDKDIRVEGSLRIAVPIMDNNQIDQHFGKANRFKVYDIFNHVLVDQKEFSCAGDGHESATNLLKEQQINTVICGGIGQEALETLLEEQVKVYPGMTGDVDVVVASYLDGGFGS